MENQLSQKDKKISDLEDKVIALKGRIAGLDAYICELNGELRTYNPLPGVRAILCNAGKFVDGSLKKNAVNEMKSLIGEEMGYKDDDLKELTNKISRILKNELLIDGLDSNFPNNVNLKKEVADAIQSYSKQSVSRRQNKLKMICISHLRFFVDTPSLINSNCTSDNVVLLSFSL